MSQQEDHADLKQLLRENSELIKENNTLLKKIHRNAIIGIVLRILWYSLLIGLPFALYFWFLEPYFDAFGSNYQVFIDGLSELPGLRGLDQLINSTAEQVDVQN